MTLKHWRFRISLAMFPLLHCCTRSSTGISVAVSNTLYLGGQFFHSFLLLNHLGWQQEMKIFYSPRVPLFELCCLLSCICLPCLRLHWDTILHVTCLNIFENHRFFETQWKHFHIKSLDFFPWWLNTWLPSKQLEAVIRYCLSLNQAGELLWSEGSRYFNSTKSSSCRTRRGKIFFKKNYLAP